MQTIDPRWAVEVPDENPRDSRGRELRAAAAAHAGWRSRYALGLCLIDWAVGLLAASSALLLRFGADATESFLLDYLLLTLLFPLAWVAVLAINRAYESRHLFVGTDEYARVVRSGIGLTAVLAMISFAFDLRLARGYVIIAVPLATLVDVGARYLLRQLLHRSWARGERLHRVILIGHARAVADMTRRLRNERHHGLGIVGACLPSGLSTEGFGSRACPRSAGTSPGWPRRWCRPRRGHRGRAGLPGDRRSGAAPARLDSWNAMTST